MLDEIINTLHIIKTKPSVIQSKTTQQKKWMENINSIKKRKIKRCQSQDDKFWNIQTKTLKWIFKKCSSKQQQALWKTMKNKKYQQRNKT